MISEHLHAEDDVDPLSGCLRAGAVVVGIETDRGTWVQALLAARCTVHAIDPVQAARYRQRHTSSGAEPDVGDAGVLAGIVRLDAAHHRPVTGDSQDVEGLELLVRAHQSAIRDRTRELQRLTAALPARLPHDAHTLRRAHRLAPAARTGPHPAAVTTTGRPAAA
ncbi:hypothetical protein GCM10027586_00590 [Kineococcus gypseus]|uniref:IS110 family transposase n=1 Tax=Kineococcus gypseus TaxID=1637102 RepID=UPI003D7EC769